MSYLGLLVLCLLPPVALLARSARSRDVAPAVPARRQAAALALLVLCAVLATLPWDRELIRRGTWTYPQTALVGHVAGVPVEELLFMVLQPLLVGLWLRVQPRQVPARPCAAPRRTRATGAAVLLGLGVSGGLAAAVTPPAAYLGWLLAWAGPLLALQWAVGGDVLRARRALVVAAVLPPVLYLCAVDRLALHLRLWQLSPERTTGWTVAGLPVEEALFFALTSSLVVQGLLLAVDRTVRSRLGRLVPDKAVAAGITEPVPARGGTGSR